MTVIDCNKFAAIFVCEPMRFIYDCHSSYILIIDSFVMKRFRLSDFVSVFFYSPLLCPLYFYFFTLLKFFLFFIYFRHFFSNAFSFTCSGSSSSSSRRLHSLAQSQLATIRQLKLVQIGSIDFSIPFKRILAIRGRVSTTYIKDTDICEYRLISYIFNTVEIKQG